MTRALVLCLLLAGCGKLPIPGLGGPNVAANVQAGQTNHQTLGSVTDQKLVRPQARTITQSADKNDVRGENVVVNNQGISPWHVLAFITWSWLLYELPAPRHIRRWIAEKWKS